MEGSETAHGHGSLVRPGQPVEFHRLPAVPPEPGAQAFEPPVRQAARIGCSRTARARTHWNHCHLAEQPASGSRRWAHLAAQPERWRCGWAVQELSEDLDFCDDLLAKNGARTLGLSPLVDPLMTGLMTKAQGLLSLHNRPGVCTPWYSCSCFAWFYGGHTLQRPTYRAGSVTRVTPQPGFSRERRVQRSNTPTRLSATRPASAPSGATARRCQGGAPCAPRQTAQ